MLRAPPKRRLFRKFGGSFRFFANAPRSGTTLALIRCMSNYRQLPIDPADQAAGQPSDSSRSRRPRRRAASRRTDPVPYIRLPAGRFRPPHCPNRDCTFYEPRADWQYRPWGSYFAPSCGRLLPRWQCAACDRTFTPRTFAITYWLHHWDLFGHISNLSVAGSGIRQMARALGVAHATVSRHLTRAARCCLLAHQQMLGSSSLREAPVIDGFETFEHSQFFPYHLNLAAGKESWFLYHFTDSPLRRKGRMTAEQKRRREELELLYGRPDPKAVEEGVLELLRILARRLPHPDQADPGALRSRPSLEFHSDQHPAYGRAARRLQREPDGPSIIHHVTPSTARRTLANPLFPVNLADLLLRHCQADHRRETIAFDKRRQGGLERLAIFAVWRNAIKWRRENDPGETAAMRAGILTRRWSWRDLFCRRRFPRESELPGAWWDYYWRRVKTAALGEQQTENRARFAF